MPSAQEDLSTPAASPIPSLQSMVVFSSPTSSPFFDQALAPLLPSSPSRRDGRSSTDIVAFQLDDDRQGYFDADPHGSGKLDDQVKEPVVRPTGVPLISPRGQESQETTSTDKLDKEFQDGEGLITAQAEIEIEQEGKVSEGGSADEAIAGKTGSETTPKAIKRKRSVTSELQTVENQVKDIKTSLNDEDGGWDYTDDAAYAASKFGGIGEYLRHKRMKLQIQNRAIAESRGGAQYPQIFKGLEIYINGYVRPSLETLREMIMLHGGTYIPYLDRKGMITHIIASNLTPAKFREFAKYKVVTPAWITDSVEKGTLLEWKAYKLVPKGGGEEEGMRGGMGKFLARASQAVEQKRAGKQKQDEKKVEVLLDSEDEEMDLSLVPVDVQPKILTGDAANLADATEFKSKHPTKQVTPSKISHPPLTPAKSPAPLAPLFTGKSPAAGPPQVIMEGAGDGDLQYPSGAPPPTTDPPAFKRAAAMGWYATRTENPDAKRLMKSAEWREQHTAANEGFLEGYYQNSRLHHLSNWKAELKLLVAQAQSAAESSETVQSIAPGAKPVPADDLSFTDTTLPKAQARTSTTIIGQGQGNPPASDAPKVIFHVDFDAFFVSCGLATRPHLRGKPVVVCHSQGNQGSRADNRNQDADDYGKGSTSEIASCSYEARAKGVKNGMSLGQARKLCPEVQTIPYEFETYKKFSLSFYTILMAYADELQAVSVDEALIDVTSQVHALASAPPEFELTASAPLNDPAQPTETAGPSENEKGPSEEMQIPHPSSRIDTPPFDDGAHETVQLAPEIDWAKVLAEKIRTDVREATGCEVSIGIANNILLARLATRHAKPAGSFHLVAEAVPTFMADLEVDDLPNFGWSTQQKIMEKFGTKKCGELLDKPKGVLQAVLGNKTGESLYNFIRGIDKRKLEPHKERKSVSAEVNYGIRFISNAEAEKFLLDLSKEVSKRLKAIDRVGRLVTLKVMVRHPDAPLEAPKFMGHGVCDVVNKSAVLSNGRGGATDDPTHIGNAVLAIYRAGNFDATELRGIGIQVQKLEGNDDTLPAVEDGQHRLAFAIKPPQEKQQAETPPAKNIKAAMPSTIISVPSGNTDPNEDEVVAIEFEDVAPIPGKASKDGTLFTRSAQAGHMSKFGRRGKGITAVAPAIIPPAPDEIDPDVWAILPQEDQSAYRQAWINQGLKVPHVFLAHKRAATSRDTNEPRLLFPDATKPAKSKQDRGRSTSVRAGKKERSESVVSRIKDGPKRREARSVTPANSEIVDISGSSTPPKPGYRDTDLIDLGIDPQVFENLPVDVQGEVYREATASRTTRQHLTKRGVSANPITANAGFRSPQKRTRTIAVAETLRPKMNGTSDIEDIMDMVREWMERSFLQEPNPTEIKVIRKYLLRCVNVETGGLGGIQDAAQVLGYWRRTCVRLWPSRKHDPDSEHDKIAQTTVEASWKRVFRDIRREVDDLVQARYGISLVLP